MQLLFVGVAAAALAAAVGQVPAEQFHFQRHNKVWPKPPRTTSPSPQHHAVALCAPEPELWAQLK